MYNMQYFLLSSPCFLVHILPHFVAQIVTCSISYGLWPHVVGLNEQNKYHIISFENAMSQPFCSKVKNSAGVDNKISLQQLPKWRYQSPLNRK